MTHSASLFAALAFRGWFPVWLAALMALAATAGAVALYYREAGRVPAWRRAILAGLRVLTLVSLAVLLLRPTILTENKLTRYRPVALMVDDSQSMLSADPRPNFPDRWRAALAFDKVPADKPLPPMPSEGDIPNDTPARPTRLEVAKAALANPRLKLVERIGKLGPLQPASFGSRRAAKDPKDPTWIAGMKGDEPRTALADALFDILKRDENELPSAVVVVTDGRENASLRGLDEAGRECARLNVPLHIYGVGSSGYGQLQIRDVGVAETLFVDDTIPVPVRYRAKGFPDGQAEIVVTLGGKEVAKKTVDLKDGDDLKEMLTFVPDSKPGPKQVELGRQELVTTVTVNSGGERVSDQIAKSVRVVDRKMKVLVIDSAPRWDFKFLQRSLMRDRRVEPKFFLTDADPRAMKSGDPFIPAFPADRKELFAFDLIVVGDFPAGSLTPEQQGYLREFVAEGGGLIHIAGRQHGPASFVGTPLADVLPVEVPATKFPIDSGVRPTGYRPELTPTGLRSGVLSLADDPVESLRTWRKLPELYWFYPVTKLKPASEVYLTHPTQKTIDNKPMPLLAAHYYGKGYVVYLGLDETWRWRFNEADRLFARFWSQVVYAAGSPRTLGTKVTQLSMDTSDPQLGKTGQVYARLFTTKLDPLVSDRVEARLERLDAGAGDAEKSVPVELRALPGQPGEYVATVPFNRVGRFALKVDPGTEAASLEYRVTLPPEHEMAPGGLAEDDLRKLAEASGGKYYREEDLHTLAASITPKSSPFAQREEILLWNKWLMLWVIGLLSAEWFLRKFNSMS